MIKRKYYSEMLETYFDTKNEALAAEAAESKRIIGEMRQCRKYYVAARHVLRRAHEKRMSDLRSSLQKAHNRSFVQIED